jgi:hypothetical protein
MPENAVYIGRGTVWGNPFKIKIGKFSRSQAIRLYRAWLCGTFTEKSIARIFKGTECPPQPLAILRYSMIRGVLRQRMFELRGKDLACWCPLDQPCHADVLLEIANS